MGWLRHPRTTQERRANGRRGLLRLDDYEVTIRPSRCRLPSAWDDLIKPYRRHVSWKKFRRTQYK